MATNKKYSNIDLSKYNKGYQASQDVINAQKLKEQAEGAVSNYGDFNYSNQAGLKAAMDALTNRKAFSYDLNADALYQQYKDNYISQGKQAMMDATGQAAALTGGYGNSYANTVGNQAYQGYLQQLNGIIPDLHNLALSTYQAEGDRLKDNYGILSDDRDREYAKWGDKYNMFVTDRGYYADAYNNAYNQDYTKYTDNRNYDQNQYWNEYEAGYQADRDAVADSQWQKNYDESIRQYEANLAYQKNRDKIADAQWQKQFDEGVRQYNEQMAFNKAQAARSGSGGSTSKGSNLKTPTQKMYAEALEAYKNGGVSALEQYCDTVPAYDYEMLMNYATEYGDYKYYANRVGNRDYAAGAPGRDAFDSSVRSKYANRKKK